MLNFSLGLQGFFGSLENDVQVKVAGFSDNYLVKRAFRFWSVIILFQWFISCKMFLRFI